MKMQRTRLLLPRAPTRAFSSLSGFCGIDRESFAFRQLTALRFHESLSEKPKNLEEKIFTMHLPFLKGKNQVNVVRLSSLDTMASFGSQVAEQADDTVTFFDAEGNTLATSEQLKDWISVQGANSHFAPPLFMKVGDQSYKIDPYPVLAESQDGPATDFEKFCSDLNLPKEQQVGLSDYARKLHLLARAKHQTVPSLKQQMQHLNLLEAVEDKIYSKSEFGAARKFFVANQQFEVKPEESLTAMMQRRHELTQILAKVELMNEKIACKAKRRANLAGYSVTAILMAQMAFITQGTFVTLSWDIMEPISYMIGMFNFTTAFGWYYLFITKPDSQTVTEWMENRLKKKLLRKYGVEPEAVEQIKKELAEVEEKMDQLNL